MHICTYVHMCVCVYIYIHVYYIYVYMYICIFMYLCIYLFICICIHTYTHLHIHIYQAVYMYIYMPTGPRITPERGNPTVEEAAWLMVSNFPVCHLRCLLRRRRRRERGACAPCARSSEWPHETPTVADETGWCTVTLGAGVCGTVAGGGGTGEGPARHALGAVNSHIKRLLWMWRRVTADDGWRAIASTVTAWLVAS